MAEVKRKKAKPSIHCFDGSRDGFNPAEKSFRRKRFVFMKNH